MSVLSVIGKIADRFLFAVTPQPVIILIRKNGTLRVPAGIEGPFSAPGEAWEYARQEGIVSDVEAWLYYLDNPRMGTQRVEWPPRGVIGS